MILINEKVNLGRQKEFDVIKTFAIFFMIIIHVLEELSSVNTEVICSTPLNTILQFLGGPLSAPVFMFAMGLGMSYSKHNSPNELMYRGLKLLIFSYVLNIIRFVIPLLIRSIYNGFDRQRFFYELFQIDILTFAGLAFVLTGFLKKIKVPVLGVLGIAFLLQAIGNILSSIICFDSEWSIYLFGVFVKTDFPSYFPLFLWYIYPALGLVFAKYLRHIEYTDIFYKGILFVSSTILCSFCAMLYFIGYDVRNLFGLHDEIYYNQTFLHTIFAICCVLIEISIVHFLLKLKFMQKLEKFFSFMSNNLNNIYIVQWIIIGWLYFLLIGDDHEIPQWAIVPFGIVLIIVSSLIILFYTKIKAKKKADT